MLNSANPYIVTSANNSGVYQATIQDIVQAGSPTITRVGFINGHSNAYFLSWGNNTFTQGLIDLNNKDIEYFFTADFSGCSLWCRIDSGNVFFRHEARTTPLAHQQHLEDGYRLIFDSNRPDVQVELREDNGEPILRNAQYYVIFAEVLRLSDQAFIGLKFHIQHVFNQKDIQTKNEIYDLLSYKEIIFN
ncbi:hypothetical protein [Dickeya fangzhongdai]|uniref:hypothetical protein n=1 Tax=Dickeya fangzhongdai TaxID=1778540 RepID=UPI0004F7C6F3|nr:hypothetical protein [Dickeya fangzhongdai]AIR69541.1 hypothetical protein LH89_10115 [Dickeya fangzhongdai]KGT98792.1 hypothetical protein NM75_07900 [Dickeya fangzhongdai]